MGIFCWTPTGIVTAAFAPPASDPNVIIVAARVLADLSVYFMLLFYLFVGCGIVLKLIFVKRSF
jgi:hypothetical protein